MAGTIFAPRSARPPLRRQFFFHNIFDNIAAREDLGFRYTVPFVEGMRRAIGWLEANGKIESCESDPFYDWLIEV